MAQGIPLFDIWQEGYAGSTVTVYVANTTTPAAIFSDEAGLSPLANPQTLQSLTIGDRSFGKWAQAVYVNQAYYLDINTSEQTGITRLAIDSLDAEDAGNAEVKPNGRSVARDLDEHLAQEIWAEDFGAFTGSASGNNTILQAAIGAASAVGGGKVLLPSGTITFTQLTLPAGVILVGKGIDVTILQSVVADKIITNSGDRAGLHELTLDGLNKQANSVGIYSENRSDLDLDHVVVKRFATGVHQVGAQHNHWREFSTLDCDNGAILKGENLSGDGGPLQFIDWFGGEVNDCSVAGVTLDFVDLELSQNRIGHVHFDGNAIGVIFDGARFTKLDVCTFDANTTNLLFRDDLAGSTSSLAKGVGLQVVQCRFNGGGITVSGQAGDVVFRDSAFVGVTWTLTTPRNAVKLENCVEDSTTTISGDGTKLVRGFENLEGFTRGVTTGNVATKAWSLKLDPGEMCTGLARVTGKQRNGTDKGAYVFAFTAQKAPSTLAYDAQTANFTVGLVVTGQTSGASGRIIADTDAGVTGTLTLHSITGTFVDNETITDTGGGSATANGALVAGSVSVLSQASITASETDAAWNAVAAATVDEIEVQVTGNTAKTVDWTVHVDATRFG